MSPEEELIQALIEAAILLKDAVPPAANPYAWEHSRELWMMRQRIKLQERGRWNPPYGAPTP